VRRFGRIDANQREVIEGLRQVGASAYSLASLGNGAPDLLVGYRGKTFLLEVKNPNRRGGKNNAVRTLERQASWRARWGGRPVAVVWNLPDALRAIGAPTGGA